MTLRSSEYSKNLMEIIRNLEFVVEDFNVSRDCVGNICPIDKCGKDATHKITEKVPESPHASIRNTPTTYVCCDHYQNIFGHIAEERCKSKKHDSYYRGIDNKINKK